MICREQGLAFFVALLPVLLLTMFGPAEKCNAGFESPFKTVVTLLAEPYLGMLISVLTAMYALGIRQGQSLKAITKDLEEAVKAIAPILLVIAGAGALEADF